MRTLGLLTLLAWPAAAQQTTANGERPVTAGVFTDSQAVAGETVFQATCSACHVPGDLMGEQFRMNWFGRTVFDYFLNLKKTMPEDNVGGLSDDEYARVTAYILKLNGYPAGSVPLPTDSTSLARMRIGPMAGNSGTKSKR